MAKRPDTAAELYSLAARNAAITMHALSTCRSQRQHGGEALRANQAAVLHRRNQHQLHMSALGLSAGAMSRLHFHGATRRTTACHHTGHDTLRCSHTRATSMASDEKGRTHAWAAAMGMATTQVRHVRDAAVTRSAQLHVCSGVKRSLSRRSAGCSGKLRCHATLRPSLTRSEQQL